MRGAGTAGEDVKDKIGAVNNAAVELLLNVAHLAGGELIIKDGQGDGVSGNKSRYLLYLALVDKGPGIGMLNTLKKRSDGHSSCCLGKKCELIKVIAGSALIYFWGDDPNKYCAFYQIIY